MRHVPEEWDPELFGAPGGDQKPGGRESVTIKKDKKLKEKGVFSGLLHKRSAKL